MTNHPDDMLTIHEVCRVFGGAERPLDTSTIYRWMREGKLPRPLQLGPTYNRWKRSDVQAALEAMVAAQAAKKVGQ